MKWVLIVGGVLLALVLGVAVVGALLPQRHTAKRRARYGVAPGRLFAVITDVEHAPQWRKGIRRVEVLSPTSWREDDEVTYEVVERVEPTRLVTRIAPGLPFGGTWTYELQPDGPETWLTITERGEVYNPLFRFVSRFLVGHTATIDQYLTNLGAHFGEATVPGDDAPSGNR